jgi:hypothetical protein
MMLVGTAPTERAPAANHGFSLFGLPVAACGVHAATQTSENTRNQPHARCRVPCQQARASKNCCASLPRGHSAACTPLRRCFLLAIQAGTLQLDKSRDDELAMNVVMSSHGG